MTVFLGVNSVVSLTLVSAFIISHASSQSLLPDYLRWSRIGFVEQPENNCGKNQFECKNGGCIHENLVCDGRIDCTDQSDETRAECTKPGRTCPDGAFRCDYGACAPQNATCNGIKDCFDNSDELLDKCPRPLRHGLLLLRFDDVENQPEIKANQPTVHTVKDRGPELGIPTILKTMESSMTSTTTLGSTRRPTNGIPMTLRPVDSDSPSESSESFCLAPPQPANGKWILKDCHEDRGYGNLDCEIPEGADLEMNTQLYYSCDPGYITRRYPLPRCRSSGKWSRTPFCTKVVDASTTPENVHIVEPPPERPPQSNPEINSTPPTIDSPNVRKAESSTARIDMSNQSSKISITTPRSVEKPTVSNTTTSNPVDLQDSSSKNMASKPFCVAPMPPANANWILVDCYISMGLLDLDLFEKYCNATPGSRLDVGSQLVYGCIHGYSTVVYPLPRCLPTGNWSRTPVCTKVVDGFVEDPTEKPPQSNPELTSTQQPIVTADNQEPEFNTQMIFESMASSKTSTTTSRPTGRPASMKTTTQNLADVLSSSEPSKPFCLAPPRPTNGYWWQGDIPEGTKIGTKVLLLYNCNKGYSVSFPFPQCLSTGEWTAKPGCLRNDNESDSIKNDFDVNEPPKELLQSNPKTMSRPIENLSITKTTTPSPADLGNPSSTSSTSFCLAPPQPANGKWMLIGCGGSDNEGCQIPEGTKIETNSLVQYACDPGYSTKVNPLPRCLSTGKWSRTPVCTKVDAESDTAKPEYLVALPPENYLLQRR